jgi:flavin reductase (DIM6/NTAB) family NADH-FMN oxidoreductase RutF
VEHTPFTALPTIVENRHTVGADEFRSAAGRFASGVGVVAARRGNRTLAKTVSSFTSVSLNPPLISVCIGVASPLIGAIEHSACFTISILRAGQQHISDRLSAPGSTVAGTEAVGIATTRSQSGAAVVAGYLSYFDCTVETSLGVGDHTIVIGRVRHADSAEGEPLMYFAGGYHVLSSHPSAADHRPRTQQERTS